MRIGRFFSYAAVAVLASFGTLATVWVKSGLGDRPYPEPFQSLPQATADIPAAVQSVVEMAFPVGTPENELIAKGSQWAFVFDVSEGQLRADYVAGGFICSHYLSITWKSNEQRQVSEVFGGSHLSCL
jgi:hypothetical protein